MAFVVAADCLDVLDRSCVEVCPVDCIYEGGRKAYIHPEECVDCGACEPVCPVNAIAYADDVPEEQSAHVADNAAFFHVPLPGREEPLGYPGGARDVGPLDVDTPSSPRCPAPEPDRPEEHPCTASRRRATTTRSRSSPNGSRRGRCTGTRA